MTEQEAISCLNAYKEYLTYNNVCEVEEIDVAIKALEEIQQYRAIGTQEECRAAVEKLKKVEEVVKEWDKGENEKIFADDWLQSEAE